MADGSKMTSVPVWALSVEDTLKALKATSLGLSDDEAEKRRQEYGTNELPRGKRLTGIQILLKQFTSPLVFILIAAAIVTAFLHEWVDTGIILLATILNAGLGFFQEFRAENALEKLTTYIKERTRVVRGGLEQEIDAVLLVPGDIVRLQYGARTPADCRLLSENALSVDESILTGESLPVHKTTDILSEATMLPERTNMVYAGTLVVEGTGEAVVSGTDDHTEIGRIARLVSETESEQTPLQRALSSLAWFIFIGITLIVGVLFAVGIARGEPFLDMLLLAIAVAVGSIPEALPVALTVILAIGLQRLAARKGVIRNLAAAETLGSATVIMTDKTGTLTEANMQVTAIQTLKEMVTRKGLAHELGRAAGEARTLLSLALASTNVLIQNPTDAPKVWRFVGRPIEVGIVKAAHERGISLDALAESRTAILLPFNSTHKFAIARAGTEYVVVGAPDILLARSAVSKDDYLAAEAHIHTIAGAGERILGIALLPRSSAKKFEQGTAHPDEAQNLVFLGIILFRDPIRPDAKQSLEKIEHLGARVVMVTGDLKGTAIAVARNLGWSVDEGQVLSGEEVHSLSDEELSIALSRVKIFARVTPEDKLRIGKLYMRNGEIVAMTGDGVNDAPSLKAVNIGVALGSGSDVAKGVADLVILDDNFKTIVAAIEEGRRILDNIRKTLVYLLSSALDGVALIGGSLLLGLPLPLNALQIIWVNLVTEGFPALSFAFDKEHETRHSGRLVFNTQVRVLTVGISVLTSVIMFVLYWGMLEFDVPLADARSLLFACFSLYVLVVAFSFRSLNRALFTFPTFGNHALNWSVGIGALVIVATFAIPPLREVFNLVVPPLNLWWIVVVWLFGNIAIVETAKWGFRKFTR